MKGALANSKHIGLLILVTSCLSMAVYSFAVVYATTLVLQLTALVAVLGVLGTLAWIGYTMFTEPPQEASITTQLNDIQVETINPEEEHQAITTRPRFSKVVDCEIGKGTVLWDHVNLYKCRIGKNCKVESFTHIEEGVTVGDECKIKPHVYIPTGVIIEDQVFLGPNVTFTNDKYPRAKGDWKLVKTLVGRGASIGAHSVILPGVQVGKGALVGAGSVVTTDVPDGATVCGNPAKRML